MPQPPPSQPPRGEQVWFQDPRGFLVPANLAVFFPVRGMTLAQQLNATLRFAIYFAAVLLVAGRTSRVLFIPILVAAGTYAMYVSAEDTPGVLREGHVHEGEDAGRVAGEGRSSSGGGGGGGGDGGDRARPPCTRPTKENPFMNVLQSDYGTLSRRQAACDIQDPKVRRRAEAMFVKAGAGLVRDADDIFHRRASSRQFVTNPSTTVPNDQAGFAAWLYGTPPTCKTVDRGKCAYRN